MPSDAQEWMMARVVRVLGDFAEPIGNPEPALPVLLPRALARKERRFRFTHGGDGWLEAGGQWLPGEFVEQRLAIEGIEVARAAFHEKENDVSRARYVIGECGGRGDQRLVIGREHVFAHQRGEGHGAEAAAGAAQELAAGSGEVVIVAGHGG